MRFPIEFQRRKGAGSLAVLGSDSSGGSGTGPAVTTPPWKANQDNLYAAKRFDGTGWPVHRIAVTYHTDAPTPVNLNARMYLWLENTQTWYQVGAQVAMVPDQVSFFDVIALLDAHASAANPSGASPGAPVMQLIVDDPGAGANDGTYTFCMAGDLTTQA